MGTEAGFLVKYCNNYRDMWYVTCFFTLLKKLFSFAFGFAGPWWKLLVLLLNQSTQWIISQNLTREPPLSFNFESCKPLHLCLYFVLNLYDIVSTKFDTLILSISQLYCSLNWDYDPNESRPDWKHWFERRRNTPSEVNRLLIWFQFIARTD